jgi:signal recognition particle subunit SRP54
MIPGASKAMKDVGLKMMLSNTLKPLHSMTPIERTSHICYRCKRKARIAKGSGTKITSKSTDETV